MMSPLKFSQLCTDEQKRVCPGTNGGYIAKGRFGDVLSSFVVTWKLFLVDGFPKDSEFDPCDRVRSANVPVKRGPKVNNGIRKMLIPCSEYKLFFGHRGCPIILDDAQMRGVTVMSFVFICLLWVDA